MHFSVELPELNVTIRKRIDLFVGLEYKDGPKAKKEKIFFWKEEGIKSSRTKENLFWFIVPTEKQTQEKLFLQ